MAGQRKRSRVERALAPRGYVDAFDGRRVVGWAFGKSDLEVEAWLGGTRLASCRPDSRRIDVAASYAGSPSALDCGFSLDLPDEAIAPDAIEELQIVARPSRRWLPAATLATFQVCGRAVEATLANASDSGIVGPFPRGVIDAVAAVWPQACRKLTTEAGQFRFVSCLRTIMATPGLASLPVFADYARYVSATWAHCRYVDRYFPVANATASAGASDFHCKPNSTNELFPIIHQLYVLKSWGVSGAFAEFGCFKGFSSAMLSFACQQLGLSMHIFDSFEGLPPAEGSGYRAGDYAGSIEEVRDHVTRFGAIEAVEFHKGFFADTFREWRPPRLMCLWMDVDLEVSARDLMVVADRLDPRAGLFSHECEAAMFQDGEIVTSPRLDNPVPPILARFAELDRPLTGSFVAGNTGAFWPRERGIPVVAIGPLKQLAQTL